MITVSLSRSYYRWVRRWKSLGVLHRDKPALVPSWYYLGCRRFVGKQKIAVGQSGLHPLAEQIEAVMLSGLVLGIVGICIVATVVVGAWPGEETILICILGWGMALLGVVEVVRAGIR